MQRIDKNIIYLGWISFSTDFASSMVTILLPLYVVYILNEGVDKPGIIIAVASFIESPRVFRRLSCLSHATMADPWL